MKIFILLFLAFMVNIHFVKAQFPNPLGLAFDGTPTLTYCSVKDKPICKMKVKIMTPPASGGMLHISATIDGVFPYMYHVHDNLTGLGQIVDIEFIGTASSAPTRIINVVMYLGSLGSNDNVSTVEYTNPRSNYNLNPELVVKASNTPFSDLDWYQSQIVTPSSLFQLRIVKLIKYQISI